MPIAQTKTIVHCHAQDDRVKVGMFSDHLQVILHRAGLYDILLDYQTMLNLRLLKANDPHSPFRICEK